MNCIKQFLLKLIDELRFSKKATVMQSDLDLYNIKIEEIQAIFKYSGINIRILNLNDRYEIEII